MEQWYDAELFLSECAEAPPLELVDGQVLLPRAAPFGVIEYAQPGFVIYESEHVRASYSYNLVPGLPSSLRESDFSEEEWARYQEELWAEMTGLVMLNKVNDACLDLHDIGLTSAGKPYTVFFPQGDTIPIEHSAIYPDSREIVLAKNPFSAQGIITLFHELGHMEDEKINPEIYKKCKYIIAAFKRGEEKAINDILRCEMNAWEYAFRKLTPFLSNDPYSELSLVRFRNSVYHESLEPYRDEAMEARRNRKKLLAGLAIGDYDW